MKTDFTKLPLGTRVWNFTKNEYGVIILLLGGEYPVRVEFDNGEKEQYTSDGRCFTTDKNPDLFLQKFEIPEQAFEMPLPELPVDAKILVGNYSDDLLKKRYFSHWENGEPVCFIDGCTSWNKTGTATWKYWKLPEEK